MVLGLGIFLGCQPKAPHSDRPLGPVELKVITGDELESRIAQEKGKVVFAECWFYGCGPCRKKFPLLSHLHEHHASKGLTVMSVNVMPEEISEQENITKFLKNQRADYLNFIFKQNDPSHERWLAQKGIRMTPTFLAYNRAGESVPVPEPASADDIEQFLVRLLAEAAPQ
jgi:thiol-disulfide isomerase/thioredoxin